MIFLRKINVGIIGLGKMGSLHLMSCLHMKDIKVIAVSDTSKKSINKVKKFRVKNVYDDYRDLINNRSDNLDAVIISLPNFLHFDSIQRSLEAGLDVFVEKPMAINTNESREIVKLAEKNGRKLMPGHCMRYLPAVEKMRTSVNLGKLGDLKIITLESIQNGPLSHDIIPKPVPEWWFDLKKSGGGALLDLGYHLVDLFSFFAGDSNVQFAALDYNYHLPVEDSATIILKSKSSVRGVINVGWFEKSIFPRVNFRMILHGTADFISTEQLIPSNMYFHAAKEGISNFLRRVAGRKIHPLSYTYYYEPHFKELRHFFDSIENDTQTPITAVDGLRTIEIIEEAYQLSQKVHDSVHISS